MEYNKTHALTGEMTVVAGLIEHLKDNLDDTIFENGEELHSLLETLSQGCNIAALRMQQMIKDHKENKVMTCGRR